MTMQIEKKDRTKTKANLQIKVANLITGKVKTSSYRINGGTEEEILKLIDDHLINQNDN